MILVNGPPGSSVKTKRETERSFPRPDISCEVLEPDSGRSWAAWVRDVSPKGISVLLEAQFEVGALLVIATSLPGKGPFQKKFRVRHSGICFPNNSWLHGCQFCEPLAEEEFAEIRGKPTGPGHVSEGANAQ